MPETSAIEGVLRRASVPERAPREASLGVEGTQRDKKPNNRRPEKGRRESPVEGAPGRPPPPETPPARECYGERYCLC